VRAGSQALSAAAESVTLGVSRVSVVHFHAVFRIEEKAVVDQHSSAVGGGLLNSVAVGTLYETSERLNRCFIAVNRVFLREGRQREQRASRDQEQLPMTSRCRATFGRLKLLTYPFAALLIFVSNFYGFTKLYKTSNSRQYVRIKDNCN